MIHDIECKRNENDIRLIVNNFGILMLVEIIITGPSIYCHTVLKHNWLLNNIQTGFECETMIQSVMKLLTNND